MKRVIVFVFVMVAILAVPPPAYNPPDLIDTRTDLWQGPRDSISVSSSSGTGDTRASVVFASRQVNSLSIPILNTFASTSVHSGFLDLSSHLIPGWSLYEVEIDVSSITAVREYVSLNVNPSTYIRIRNDTASSHLTTDALYQEFYKQPYDGKLENYTISYIAPLYDDVSLGIAHLVVRSDYSDSQTNTTGWISPFIQTTSDTMVTHDCSSDNAILNASTSYFVVIDGTGMQGVYSIAEEEWLFNKIYWSAQPILGLDTGGRIRDYPAWYSDGIPDVREAELNYTYTPWNKTANSALTFSSPSQVSMKGNLTDLQGTSWTFEDAENLTLINFEANLSVNMDYNMTLWYRQSVSSTASWNIPISGADVEWSIESTIEYPETTQSNYLNISIPETWDSDGLYNSTHPSNNHTSFSSTGAIITCSQLYNDTWTLELTSENLMKNLKTYKSLDDTEVISEFMMTSNIDINSTIQEPDTDPVTTGTISLEILYSGSEFWTPSDKSVTNGFAHYFWNISNPLTTNGEYTIEIHWSNGTEAGYLSKTLLLYYPTSMAAESYNINAYTESSFNIRVTINDTFTPQGLNGTYASLVYSFDGAANQSMTDLNNGTWTAAVSTAGKIFGDYDVLVFATGYAIENRSLQINATLIHDTESLTILWSNTNDITFVESTELSVAYRRVGGTPIPGATLNVTIDSTTWTLVWDGVSETYKKIFSGSDVPPGLGVHSLTIQAWKDGHKTQTDISQTLTLQEEPTTLDLTWSSSNSITYVGSTTLIANYTMNDGSPVLSAAVNVTIGLDTWTMTWNGVTETYEYVFDGDAVSPGLGVHSVTVEAGKFGYVYRSNSSLTLNISEEPTTLFLTWNPDFDITYIEETYLIANYTMSDGSPVVGAIINVTINSNVFDLTWHAPSQTYRLLINGSDNPPGLGTFPISIQADLHGFYSKVDNTETLILQEDPTILILSWSDGNSITYIEQTTLSASYTMSNGSAIRDAMVNVTIGGNTWQLLWHEGSQSYRTTFLGTDDPPGFGTNGLTVQADLFGFVDRTDSSQTLTIDDEPTTLVLTFSYDFTITYIEETYLIANYTMSDGSPVLGATVNVTILSDVWNLNWHAPTQTYRVLFKGTDDPPGIGIHSLTVQADLFGYASKTDSSKNLVINEDPTTLNLSWSDGNNITYIGQTTLSASYTMSNGSAIRGALVNVTIGVDTWLLNWHEGSETYRVTFLGTDNPPGFGTHSFTVDADLFGFVSRSNSTEQLIIREEPTTMTISWSNGFDITYVEQTTLSITYRMSNTTPISDASITVTIGVDVWIPTWNPVSEAYEVTFRGDDDPPGLGVHTLTIDASRTGYESQSDDTESLTLDIEPTSLQLEWFLSDTITYVEQTVLYANFTMSNGSAIVGAYVTAAIGSSNKTFEWSTISEVYYLILKGNDPGYELGTHPVTIQATLFGYEQRNDNTQTLTVQEEPTTTTPSWNPDNNITYFESTTLSVRYDMSNGTAIPGAVVNITIGTDVWTLTWNPVSESYEVTLSGSDNPPGYGIHSIELRASKYGYVSVIDSSLELTIRLEDTKISFEWDPSDTITYVGQAKIRIFYQLINGTPVQGATVNITRGPTTWEAVWNSTSQSYEYTWLGTDDPPGLSSHLLLIKAWKVNYVDIADMSQTLTINEEPTLILISWSNGNNITYVQSTILLVNFTTSSGVVIPDALVDVTIGTDNWILAWNATSQFYEYTFTGSDSPPGLGTHSLSTRGWKYGYETTIDGTGTLTLREEPTTLTPTWNPGNVITYVKSTTLSVRYEMSNSNPISSATVNVTIGTDVWTLSWNPVSEAYEYTFSGSDSPPGLGVHTMTIQASKWGYQDAIDTLETLTLTEEPTSFVISWSNGNNITYVKGTTISVRYQMSDTSSIPGAVVNVTINGNTWTLTWNPVSEAYEGYFAGSDDPPGYGTHVVEIKASKFGYESIIDSSQNLTIRFEDTSISFEWDPSYIITYVEGTKIRISYLMSNGTPILGATVNITGPTTWIATWNSTSQAYEYSWLGTDDPPGLGSHLLLIKAWKVNYVGITDVSQTLVINEEPTQIQAGWSDGNSISFTENTTLLVNFTSSNGTVIPFATVNVTIGIDLWPLVWNSTSQLYEVTFSNESTVWPGLGIHGLTIRAKQFGYENAVDISQTLTINSEQVSISSELLGGSTITYIESTVLVVNYTTIAGVPITGATVNVTISGTLWDLRWDPGSETYRIRFNGSDSPPGFGTHNLIVNASSFGFDALPDSSQFLTIIEEPTTLDVYWGAPNFNNVTYFDYTILFAEYKMSNGSVIQGAVVNVTIASTTWTLEWNSTQGAYSLRFNGSDIPPGLGTHSLTIETDKFGYEYRIDVSNTLILSKDPTTLGVVWVGGNDISYVEYTTLSVTYKMSNGSDILGAVVNATIGSNTWALEWNATAGAYQVQFTGDQDPPGLGSFTVTIQASADVFVAQMDNTTLTIQPESTTATPSWSSITFDWTESAIFSVDFRDSYGSLIDGATTKVVYINGTEYELLGTNGTYWIEFNNTFDLGLHNIWANFSKFGYDSATALSISFTIIEAPTTLTILWSSTTIDYLGQSDLTVDYYCISTGFSVPSAGVLANISIDGATPVPLTLQGGLWIANLSGVSLDLGPHNIVIRAWVHGYEYSETTEIVIVNEVSTNPLAITWNPANLTIEYTDSFDLTVDYTYYGGDVPVSATVNVTIDGRPFNLTYSGGLWMVSIAGADLGIGLHTATVNAWLYGYTLQTDITANLNVTVAANTFLVTWEPWDLDASYIDIVNASVAYTQDFLPIVGATVQLTINGTLYVLTYSAVDEMWHFSMLASDIGLGSWNVTVTANKTGFVSGWDSNILTISLAATNLTVIKSATNIYYDEDVTLDIYYQLLNTSTVPGAVLTLEVNGFVQLATWDTDHWTYTSSGDVLGLGVHSVYVYMDAFGYQPATESFDVTVVAIPTSVTTPTTNISIFAYESTNIMFTWMDDKNTVAIPDYVPEITWSDSFSVVDHGNGSYSVVVNSNALHVGNYELLVNFVRTGYVNGTLLMNIEILELPIVLVFDDEIEQFENESITINIQMFDGPHATVVDWGEITLELAGVQYALVYNPESELYSVEIWLSTLSPGVYTINFTATAVDCETEAGEIQLEITPKITYELTLEVDEEIQAGQQIQIIVSATYESGVANGLPLTVHIVIERGQATPEDRTEEVTTDVDGLALLDFDVPLDATGLTIWAEFDGTEREWSATSYTVNREVTPSGFDILSFIFSLIEDPVTLMIIVGGGGGFIAGLILLKRRRGKPRVSTPSVTEDITPSSVAPSVTEDIAPPSVAPTAPEGEMDVLQNEIKQYPVGLTRAQIAKALDISRSKAGVLVKKLLESDPRFEEIIEGRLRRIRFNPDE